MNNVKEKILTVLRESDDFVSGQALCDELCISRTAVSKHVQGLRLIGYKIESIPRRGHRLVQSVDTPLDVEVKRHLKTRLIGKHYTYHSEVSSTNSELAALALSECKNGMVIAADKQKSGRGRMQRNWFSPSGFNLYYSVLLQPKKSPSDIPQLALVAALAIIEAIQRIDPDIEAGVKWPNDIFINGKKVAGVLCEMQAETDMVHKVILGVGINVNLKASLLPPSIRETATSLYIESGKKFDRPQLMAALLNSLEDYYLRWLEDGITALLPKLEEHLLLVGKHIKVVNLDRTIEGIVQGLSPEGGLLLKSGRKVHNIHSGEVHIS